MPITKISAGRVGKPPEQNKTKGCKNPYKNIPGNRAHESTKVTLTLLGTTLL